MQKGVPVKIPLLVNLHIEQFSGGYVTRINSGATNVVFDQYEDGKWYATQRPGINQLEDASATVADARGRGCYFWDAVSDKYIANANKLYKASYAGTSMTLTTGTQRLFMSEIGDYLLVLDQENNEGWTISSGAPTTLNAIADLDFPPNQTPALSLARGGAVLNGKAYVLTTDGDIYECDVENPTAWNALNFRNAEYDPDGGVAIAKHNNHVVVFGTRSLEFFQDTANPTGSTLSPRQDIQYDVGAVDADSIWQIGNRLYFCGQDRSGSIGAYVLDGMQLQRISGEDMCAFLTTAVNVDGVGILGCGFESGGREFYVLTLSNLVGDIAPTITLVFSSVRGWWGFWDAALPGVDLFPLVAWMPAPNTRNGEGILVNGDLVTLINDMVPQDRVNASAVYEAGVFEAGVFTATASSGTNIPFEIITGQFYGDNPRKKFMGDLWLEHTPLAADETVDISWADEQNDTYGTARTLSVKDPDARIGRLGSFRRRNFKVEGSLSEQARLESLRGTARASKQ